MTVPVENLDADLWVPSIEVLSSTENLEESVYPEISASEVISADAEPNVKLENILTTNNVLNVTNNATRNNESGSSEDDIPSFSEWTLKVLAEEEKSGKIRYFFYSLKLRKFADLLNIHEFYRCKRKYWCANYC